MIGALRQYANDEVLPRWRKIALQPQLLAAVALGTLAGRYGSTWAMASLKMTDAATMLLTYAAIAFGFCIAGLALVLTLPNETFVSILMDHKLKGHDESSYSDLVFIFSWTAVVHWAAVVLLITAVGIRGPDLPVLKFADGPPWKALTGAIIAISTYALAQFLLTVITLSQVARLYARKLARGNRK